jgi:hypothetical protein
MGRLKTKKDAFHTADEIDYIIKFCGISNIFICLAGAIFSYLIYGEVIGSNNSSWLIGIVLALIGLMFHLIIFFNKNLSPMVRWSGAGVILCISFSYLFTSPTISHFVYSSMPSSINQIGLLLISSIHIYWLFYSYKNIHLIFSNPKLLPILYKEDEKSFIYSNGIQQEIIEEKLKRRYYPHPACWVLIIILSPVSFFIHILITPTFGVDIFHIILALLSLPFALLFNGLAISTLLVSFYYPKKLKTQTGKEVRISSRLA